jgi:diadenosine tetraphosphate (Ap4A) HIT family hydrolase
MRRLVRRLPGRVALRVAKTTAGARLAALVVAWAPWLLPVARLSTDTLAVAFRHPRPEVRGHVVVVPRRYVRDICALLQAPTGIETFRALIETAERAASQLPPADRLLSVNVGRRQEVPQLHGHLLPALAAPILLANAVRWLEAPRHDTAALRAALEAAVDSLGGCAGHIDGSLVVTGLGTPAWRIAASIAPASRTE